MAASTLLLAACASVPASDSVVTFAQTDASDPYIWLEEIQGPRALEQVEEWNADTEARLTAMPGYASARDRARAMLDDDNQIAGPSDIYGNMVANLWRDADNPRGLWRVSPLAAYVAGEPEWRVLIDVDALGEAEGESWVWHGADCLAPEYRRCLVSLSPGGTDADVVREFDMATGAFVDDGFFIPEAKTNVAWYDEDTLMVASDFGPDSLTTSGYARQVRLWPRGTDLAAAPMVAEASIEAVSAGPFSVLDGDRRWRFVNIGQTFWTQELRLLTDSGAAIALPLPGDATFEGVIGGQLIMQLQSDLVANGTTLPQGALVSWPMAELAAGRSPSPSLVFAASESQAVEQVAASDNRLWIKLLDDVSGELLALSPTSDGWQAETMMAPGNVTMTLEAVAGEADMALVTVEGMLTPPTLYAVIPDAAPRQVQSLPAQFDASGMVVEQRFATSADGTRVPYFLVRPRNQSGPVPTLIHSYGGFRAAQTPTYLTGQPYRAGPLGLFWVEQGNAYVLANIRGGGEYGPGWHEAALRENRQLVFDDLAAVAEDLVAGGIARADAVAISGRSNGGVTVGAAANQRPDLYAAVISGSPLDDMRRYSQLLAGASWMDEYGNPDVASDWEFMRDWSPYQNLVAAEGYPATFYYSSTLDDRVHPGHARKMAARHEELGQTFYFHEYREGGHSVGADHEEDARRAALLLMFLNAELPGAN